MLIVGRQKLHDFVGAHADARSWIENWIADTEQAKWRTPQDIKNAYASASFLGENVVIFKVKGNHYRLVREFPVFFIHHCPHIKAVHDAWIYVIGGRSIA